MIIRKVIRHQGDYKYQIAEGCEVGISIKPKEDIKLNSLSWMQMEKQLK